MLRSESYEIRAIKERVGWENTNKYMLVNVAWNHSKWARLEPNPNIGFGYVKRKNEAAYSPHESLNFDFNKSGVDTQDRVFGYFQTKYTPIRFSNGGVIFFWSRNTDDNIGYFIGVYGKAEVFASRTFDYKGFMGDKFWTNISGAKELSSIFPFPVKDENYRKNGRRLIYRSNFSYDFDKDRAVKLMEEAILLGKNNGDISKLELIKKYITNEL